MTLPMENNTKLFLDTLNIRGAQADGMSVGTLSMAGGGFKFLLLTFQYLVGWGIFNLVISTNLFRWVHVANLQCRSLTAVR
jgi:hypothetical protein